MEIHRDALWALCAICCFPGLVLAFRQELRRDYYSRHQRWHDNPASFLGTCFSALLSGLGFGFLAALALLALAAIYVHASS